MHDFPDSNFKLVLIDQILKNGSFTDRLKELQDNPKFAKNFTGEVDYGEPIPEIEDFLKDVKLTDEDLDKITELCFDGGNDVYQIVCPFWDGEQLLRYPGRKRLRAAEKFEIRDLYQHDRWRSNRSLSIGWNQCAMKPDHRSPGKRSAPGIVM